MTNPIVRVGILGGLGAHASTEFHRRLVTRWSEQTPVREDRDYPEVLHWSCALPGLTPAGLTEPLAAKHALVERLSVFRSWGSSLVAVPCNSLHPVLEALGPNEGLPVLCPWAAAQPMLQGLPDHTMALGSHSLRAYLGTESVLSLQVPDAPAGTRIDAVIASVIQGQLRIAARQLSGLLQDLANGARDTRHFVLACTELSVAHQVLLTQRYPLPANSLVVDTLDCLVSATLKQCQTPRPL